MTRNEWTRIRDLFERALEEKPQNISAWLDGEREESAHVRAEVASLLEQLPLADAFLAKPPSILWDAFEELSLAPGRVVGPYTIVREAGSGGMGRVYVATDARLGRLVALKAVRTPTDISQRERLQREARAAAALTHPGICTVYALEELDGNLFIASEFIEGRTLRQEMASGDRRSATEVLETARAVATALAKAHEAGVTHGDLKPENIMRAYDGQLKILDFGLARMESALASDLQSTGETATGFVAGTPGYMAPEQLNGRPRDTRTDVFAFGVVMYEYACGTHPFKASTALAMAARVLGSEPPPIDAERPDLAPELVAVIQRCLKKGASDRFASAAGISLALARQDPAGARGSVATWWRTHQLIIIGLYALASGVAWQVKESLDETTRIFLAVGIAATVAAVFRGHLLFTERVNGASLSAELKRTSPVTMTVDLFIALALAADGALMASGSPLAAVLIIALSVCLALARVVLEPSTTAGAFGTTG
jgi:predicted Ser/Thr protein kinase